MLKVGQVKSKNCQGISRRELLQVGGLGLLGAWSRRLAARRRNPARDARAGADPPKRSCIFIFLEGGPSQLETFDPKPNAPNDVRGPYGPIATNVSGVQICELLPMMATRMNRCALIRSLTGFNGAA